MTSPDSTLRAEALGWVASVLAWERPVAAQTGEPVAPVAQESPAA